MKNIFYYTNGQLKTGKTGTHSSADTSLVQCSMQKLLKMHDMVGEHTHSRCACELPLFVACILASSRE